MKKNRTWKTLLASVLVTAALVTPSVVLSSATDPLDAELIFQISEPDTVNKIAGSLAVMDDGSIQLLVDVAVDKTVNCRGASFHLRYNRDYIEPSYIEDRTDKNNVAHKANEAITAAGAGENDGFFRQDKDLFTPASGNTVKVFKDYSISLSTYQQEYYSHVDPGRETLDMDLWFDNESIYAALDAQVGTVGDDRAAEGAGKLTRLAHISNADDEKVYVFNKFDENTATNQTPGKVVLGQLSFRVNPERLAEVIDLFDGLDVLSDYRDPTKTPQRPTVDLLTPAGAKTGETFLLDVNYQDLPVREDPWQVGYYMGEAYDRTATFFAPDRNHSSTSTAKNIADHYIFDFQRDLIVDVRLTDPDFTINAYQNYTAGNTNDLLLSMGRYANMVTVTYADGSKKNEPFPWGESGSGYSVKYIKKDDLDLNEPWRDMTASAITAYDPTANVANPGVGTDYISTQNYRIFKKNADGTFKKTITGEYEVEYTFPIPVVGHMRVTPITVLDVTAEHKTKTYLINDVITQVPSVNELDLPTQARIITDIVPGNVSLVTPIKGWRSTQAASGWPTGNSDTALNALKADSYVAPGTPGAAPGTEGYPYWPDSADAIHTSPSDTANYTPAHYVGQYHFETAQTNGGTKEDILRADIQRSFPWLTVPKPSYDVGKVLREIVEEKDYADPKNYVVEYVSTVTKQSMGGDTNGNGQPTLTLSVSRATTVDMAEKSVFRVWLPNGLELGTGQQKGGVSVDNWFHDPTKTPADPTHVNGFYETERKMDTGNTKQIFHLDTNPSDPTLPVSTPIADYHNQERETLRRYINLGGWYQVAICENPDDAKPIWTDPIPVYVPPRRNEYQENKIYNFVSENKGLFNWPGGVGDVMAFPNGDYNPLTPNEADTPNGAGNPNIGLPIYTVPGATSAMITNAVDSAASVLDTTNPYLLQAGVERYSESYGVETTYDGQTGAQPGTIFSVKVDKADTTHSYDWANPDTTSEKTHASVATTPGGDPVARYGETPLYDGHSVPGYGTIHQPTADLDTYRATLRRQLDPEPKQLVERITLTSAIDDGITRQPPGTRADNVTLVTYNTVTEGYTVRQDHLLTINNVGDVDIYGLTIDNLVDGYNLNDNGDRTAPEGGHFEITVPPAQFLPAGSSTNFVLTYVYDLRANNVAGGLKYRDTLYITSSSHPDAKPGGTNQENHPAGSDYDYLLDFDAELTVSDSPLHQVTVIYRPTDGTMGTAGIIVGEQVSGTTVTMNDTATTRNYPEEESVYIHVRKKDEYAVKAVTAVIDGVTVDLLTNNAYGPGLSLPNDPDYRGTATLQDNHEVFVFEMPNHDVTVYVDFYEPIESKLRLDGLIDFSDPDSADLVNGYNFNAGTYEPTDPGHIYKVWKKEFTGKPAKGTTAATGDYAAAATWSAAHGNADEDFYLMTKGSAIPATRGGDVYNSSNAHYLVVIDAEDDFSQIRAMLRDVEYHVDWRDPPKVGDPGYDPMFKDGYNLDVEPTVNMTVYYKDQVLDNWTAPSTYAVYDGSHGFGPYDGGGNDLKPQGNTATNSYHITSDYATPPAQAGFDSPAPGESAYVDIRISYPGNAYGDDAGERHYYVEIHRRTAEPEVVLHYGNSPYGMIMNDQKFVTAGDETTTKKDQELAKTAFRAGYTFRGADIAVLPTAAKDKLQSVTYWREAWVHNHGLFEPESLTGFHPVTDGTGQQVFTDKDKTQPEYAPNTGVYKDSDNLDLNDYAFFAILGEEMWEPGVVSAKDSSGRTVSLYDIHARALDETGAQGVTLLDTTKTLQVDRFSGTDTAVIDLGVAGQKLTPLAEHASPAPAIATDAVLGVKQWPVKTTTASPSPTPTASASASPAPSASSSPAPSPAPSAPASPAPTASAAPSYIHTVIEDIRPGRYLIEYSYYDFDGVSLLTATRPFVILRNVGDVNTDGLRDAIDAPAAGNTAAKNDEYAIEDRVTHDPLGYEAGGWDATNSRETVYPHANIFKFRVADVNNDRNVNNIDANQVAKNVKDKGGWLRFYDPVDYGHPGAPITAPVTGP